MMVQYLLTISLLYYAASSQHMGPVCNITTRQYTIIDIKSSVAHNAELLNGTLALSLSDCIWSCCENDRCDLAVFKNNGTSHGNRNCYFVHCGVDENCLLVGQSHFTTVSLKKDIVMNEPPDATAEPTIDATADTSVATTEHTDVTAEASNATTETSDVTTEPTDVTAEASNATTETSDVTTEPTDVTAEASDATETSDTTTEPTDATSEPTDTTTEPTDATSEPNDATTATETDHTTTTTTTTTEAVVTIPTVPPNNESTNSTIESTESTTSQIMSSIQHESTLVVSISVTITSTTAITSSSITSTTSSSSTTSTSITLPTASTAAVNRIGIAETADNKEVMPTSAASSGPEKEPSSDDRQLCGNADCSHSKAAGLAVACLLVVLLLIIVVIVVVKKSLDRQRSKKYKRIDYLIDGMYS